MDKQAVKRYKKRRDSRLRKRGIRFDWEEEKHPRDENGRFASGGSGVEKSKKEGSAPEMKPRGKTPKLKKVDSAKEFNDTFAKNRGAMPPEKRWRVSADYSEKDYEGMEKFANENGSTFALHGTDIVSVTAGPGDRGRDVLADAVEAGGNKLDAYSGIYGFYQKCGFEPVSWTEWDDDYANPDWLEANGFTEEQWKKMENKPKDADLAVPREPIVFFKYTGKVNDEPLEEFKKRVKPKVYDEAQKERDGKL